MHKYFMYIYPQIFTSCDPPRGGWNLDIFGLFHFYEYAAFYDSLEAEVCPTHHLVLVKLFIFR